MLKSYTYFTCCINNYFLVILYISNLFLNVALINLRRQKFKNFHRLAIMDGRVQLMYKHNFFTRIRFVKK